MTREELYGLLEKGPVFLDGATGSNLQKAGMPTGVCPEQWILDHPDVIAISSVITTSRRIWN